MLSLAKSKETKFNLVFGGDNDILIDDLLPTLEGLSNLISIITLEVEPEARVQLKYKKSTQGSFIVELAIDLSGGFINLLNSLENPILIIQILGELLKLKKFLRGEPPTSIVTNNGGVYVENSRGGTITINQTTKNVYSHPSTQQSMTKMFSTERESIAVKNEESEIFEANKSEYPYFTAGTSLDETSKIISGSSRIRLQVKKPDLLGKSKWQLKNGAKVINATISDENFTKGVKSGDILMTVHTFIEVEVQYKHTLNALGNVETESYEIVKVYDVQYGNHEQTSLF